MTWNYQILRNSDGSYALHEVYCDDTGRANGRSLKAEIHSILAASVQQIESVGLSTRLRQRFAGLESDEPLFERDRTPSRPISFD